MSADDRPRPGRAGDGTDRADRRGDGTDRTDRRGDGTDRTDRSGGGTGPMDRRQALKVLAILAAAPTLAACRPDAEEDEASVPVPSGPANNPLAAGTSTDPDLLSPEIPWEPVLTADELATVAALCDVIIPADDRSPSASAVGAHDFVNEWVSAPYEANREDLVLVRGGLVWLDREAERRFGEGHRFRDLEPEQMRAICDDIHHLPDAAREHRAAARFFDRVRDLTVTAFYTTDEGMADIGYVGNVPLPRWGPPPPEVLRHLGLA